MIDIPAGCGSPGLPGETRPVAIKTPPRGTAKQRVTSPRAIRARSRKPCASATQPLRSTSSPMMARFNPAGTSALTLVRMITSRPAAGSWASTCASITSSSHLVELIEDVGGAGGRVNARAARWTPNAQPSVRRHTVLIVAGSASTPDRPRAPSPRPRPAQRLRSDMGELTGGSQSSKIERGRTRARDHHPQCRSCWVSRLLSWRPSEPLAHSGSRPASAVDGHRRGPAHRRGSKIQPVQAAPAAEVVGTGRESDRPPGPPGRTASGSRRAPDRRLLDRRRGDPRPATARRPRRGRGTPSGLPPASCRSPSGPGRSSTRCPRPRRVGVPAGAGRSPRRPAPERRGQRPGPRWIGYGSARTWVIGPPSREDAPAQHHFARRPGENASPSG